MLKALNLVTLKCLERKVIPGMTLISQIYANAKLLSYLIKTCSSLIIITNLCECKVFIIFNQTYFSLIIEIKLFVN